MAIARPSPARVRELLSYDPETGTFRWKVDRGGMKAGDIAGGFGAAGYWMIGIDRCRMYGHILAWAYMTGQYSTGMLDHRDTDRTNNSWSNIRPASAQQNAWNSALKPTNTSGHKGVSRHSKNGKWCAHIRINGKSKYLGSFDNATDAGRAYEMAAKQHFGEFARTQ